MRGRRDPISRLRQAIDCLPVETRQAMLEGIREQDHIIVGAYTDGRGGVCPMLAAHRNGSRVSFLGFARAWDAYSRATKPRRASEREVRTLTHLLEDSLDRAERDGFAAAIAEHERAKERRLAEQEAHAAAPRPRSESFIVARALRPGAIRKLRTREPEPRERPLERV